MHICARPRSDPSELSAATDLAQVQRDGIPQVMGIALHPYLVGQPYRLRALRRALTVIASRAAASASSSGSASAEASLASASTHACTAPGVWIATAGRIFDVVSALQPG